MITDTPHELAKWVVDHLLDGDYDCCLYCREQDANAGYRDRPLAITHNADCIYLKAKAWLEANGR